MNKNKFGILSMLLAVVVAFASCKPAVEGEEVGSKILINEVLMINETNYQDDYGMHSAWVELFNKSYGSYNVASHMLKFSNTPGDTITYTIPKGDVLTLISPRQHTLFWADGQPERGTFHVNFMLDPTKESWFGIYDGGNKLLNEVTIPANILSVDQSYARTIDGENKWELRGIGTGKYVTPSTNNFTLDKNAKMEKFETQDANGIGMAISAMAVVFSGLLLLYIIFRTIGKISSWHAKRVAAKAKGLSEEETKEAMAKGATPGEVFAAIAMAMHEMQDDEHDFEDTILTIHQMERRYSPWNSKIYSLRNLPKK
ncbi:MAG: OadG family protein [Bacteroidaceae bacterium]|nr:OadG family protein [Bacteroidaceae bacterium]